MTAKEIYEAHYKEYSSTFKHEVSKYEWASRNIFDLITYDEHIDEVLVKYCLIVLDTILYRTTYEFIKSEDNYIVYIVVCQLLNEFGWIDWGTSIRGAWFNDSSICIRPILKEYNWFEYEDGKPVNKSISPVYFNSDNVNALIEFITDESEDVKYPDEAAMSELMDLVKGFKEG